ncbi:VOC family protein [Aureimonas sp. ME7]|uniref:VOC family protein n=1 Tax=Aureimonas sp. ME7 TaxID=2744252 RepID=UPI0015F55FEE|nr:VOC family protein [Aureimonas sp. ME7]
MPQPEPTAADAPLHIGAVSLAVRDPGRVAAFYGEALGLADQGRDGRAQRLGVGDRTLLELVHEPGASVESPRSAGLFHTAFLLPTRADLGGWLRHAASSRIPVQGASDHGVSEALYLADPEGNGIEIYADRPRGEWPRNGETLAMVSDPLDFEDLMAAGASRPFAAAPAGTIVGHIHLRVGAVDAAAHFYRDALGLDPMQRMAGAAFLSAGGYHHHIGLNAWTSRGAGPRAGGTTGLRSFEILAQDEPSFGRAEAALLSAGTTIARTGDTLLFSDPAGIGITLRKA